MAEEKSLSEKIKDDIVKTGFPSEILVGGTLSANNRELSYNSYYIDLDENKAREIDIIATKPLFGDNSSIYFEHSLICEIKKSDQPWIIFTSEDEGFDQPGWARILYSDMVDSRIISSDVFNDNSTIKHFSRFGRSYYIAFKGNNVDIYNALCSSVKAAEADRLRFQKMWVEDKDGSVKCLSLYEPLVILNGKIFEAYMDSKQNLIVKEVKHIPISFGYLSNNYTRTQSKYAKYIVELITVDFLPNYLVNKDQWLEHLLSSINQGMKENPEK